MDSIDNVNTRKTKPKSKLLTVRMPDDLLRDFGTVAQWRDISMSEMVFNFVRQAVSEFRESHPEAFQPDEKKHRKAS